MKDNFAWLQDESEDDDDDDDEDEEVKDDDDEGNSKLWHLTAVLSNIYKQLNKFSVYC